ATVFYATNRLDGSISVIDPATRSVTATWKFGGSPDMGGVSTDGTQLWHSGRYSQSVYVLDTRTGKLLHRIRVGKGPHGLCLFPQPGRFSMGHTGNFRCPRSWRSTSAAPSWLPVWSTRRTGGSWPGRRRPRPAPMTPRRSSPPWSGSSRG